jgi:prolyl-tRNA synthetase
MSTAFWKTRKEAPADETAKNAALLIRGAYVHKEMAGVYDLLPLGKMVMDRLTNIVRKEMNAVGGQELSMTALQNPEIWKTSGRWDDAVVDNWFKTKLAAGTEVGLGLTHEEPITAMLKDHISSYRDLPVSVYQFQTKFRNELRAKSGIMRSRELLMKDLYTFSKDETEHEKKYEELAAAYSKIFLAAGIGDRTYRTIASGGIFSEFSDEFQTLCDAGEDTIYVDEKKGLAVNKEVYTDETLARYGLKKEELVEKKAIEAGNIFPLGTRFSEALGLSYANEQGEKIHPVMGSYGIGIGRLMGIIVECTADEKGLAWPQTVAPFAAHIVLVGRSAEAKAKAEALYAGLAASVPGESFLYDDREDVSAGAKFADADLLGMPYQIVVGDRDTSGDSFELKDRISGNTENVTKTELFSKIART